MGIIKGKYDFKKDIITGERGEDIIINYLSNMGFIFINKNKDYKYDFKMLYPYQDGSAREITYELKTDVYPKDTGNIVIEFESRGKLSGISITEADYFVTYFPHFGEIWNIETIELKNLIKEINPKIFECAGDKDSKTKLYSLKKTNVKDFFKIHKI